MYTILEKRVLAENIYLMRIHAPRVARAAKPGQFIIVRIDEFGERVPLTISDYDAEQGSVTIVTQAIGASTRKLCALEQGDALADFVGPLGHPSEFIHEDLDTLRKMAECHGVRIVLRDEDNEYYKPTSLDSRGYQYVKKTAQAVFPYAAVAPFILPAGTDARRFTDLSDAVIRFAPIDIDDQQYASVHGENENISIDKLPIAVDFYKQLLRNYA